MWNHREQFMRTGDNRRLKAKKVRVNIAVRIALLAWLVSLITLAIFVFVTVPQQKTIFKKNLESKANGLAVSLHDVAAGAAINEDYASVVSAAQTLLAGDPELEFLIVMKNDGFSLVIEQNSWKVENNTGSYWLERDRVSRGTIETVPMFDRRVFHFAQPFDYSGIQWGWIHVGLSLRGYDESVGALYRNTIVLALTCIFFSLLISVLYAQHIVRPIVRLRHIVQQIAGGDLLVRADMTRQDEVGSLAESVNTMAEALLRRDRILESVRIAAQQFLQTSQWEDTIEDVLAGIGKAADASRASLYGISADSQHNVQVKKIFEWIAPDIHPRAASLEDEDIPLYSEHFRNWYHQHTINDVITGFSNRENTQADAYLRKHGILAYIGIPVIVDGNLWGYLGLDDCVNDRNWTDAEEDSLRAAADMLGATIARQRAQEALLDAKLTLEQRVSERTQELQDQVAAKQNALSELASAQSSLVEMSRAAGMAEVATGVLHNVGNVLNSINVSCTLLMDQLRDSRVQNVEKVANLLQHPSGGLSHFLTEDQRGQQIPAYLKSLAQALANEHQVMFREAESLSQRIEHIKEIVSMQQSYGRVSGLNETITPEQLLEDALKLNSGAFKRHDISVIKQYSQVPPLLVDKHKVLQILLNLLTNAKTACVESGKAEKQISLRIFKDRPTKVCIQIADNGTGIEEKNLTRIFQHGFTTRSSGHGFGLHSGALAAHELGGSLTVHSDGIGHGAEFTLELPCTKGETS